MFTLLEPRKSSPCPSCRGKVNPRMLEPFCSVVCRSLGQAGLGWRLDPYRIVDPVSESILQAGPQFDLMNHTLAHFRKHAESMGTKMNNLAAAASNL